jgi:DNA-directed RNA polymerase sigma subunit (sigma70/sigma32)
MSLRRKSTEKSNSKRSLRRVGQAESSPLERVVKPSKGITSALADANLDQFLDPTSIVAAPLANAAQEAETAFQKVEEAKQRLGNLECEIISALFPSAGEPESFEDLAVRLGMSIKEVREVADNALRGLRGTKGAPPRPSSVWN